jgi:hypothetical protein
MASARLRANDALARICAYDYAREITTSMIITIGIDIGQRVDPTAIAVTELQWRPTPPDVLARTGIPIEDHYLVRHIGRLKLGTSYPDIADRLAEIVRNTEALVRAGTLRALAGSYEQEDYADLRVYIDATGVGKPVVDMLVRAGVRVTGVYFTHGDRRVETPVPGSSEVTVQLGKAFMVSRLQVLLQTRRIHLPDTSEAKATAQELLDYEIEVDEKANDTYGAFRTGAHDDLVTGLGLSVNKPPQYAGLLASTSAAQGLLIADYMGGVDSNAGAAEVQQSAFAQMIDRYYRLRGR